MTLAVCTPVVNCFYFTISKMIEEHVNVLILKINSSDFKLKEVVDYFAIIFDWIEKLNFIMAPTLVAVYVSTAISMSVVGFDIIKVGKFYQSISFFPFMRLF